MEFNEKLLRLRKQQGLTQEQLSEKLNISRAAVSKWESGRGFPNIEALKNISRLFQIPIDELLSEEELFSAAGSAGPDRFSIEDCLFFGFLDLASVSYIFLPLYAQKEGDFIRSVNLLQYSDPVYIKVVYLFFLIALGLWGLLEVVLHFRGSRKDRQTAGRASLLIHTAILLLFIPTNEPYLIFFVFLLLLSKVFWVVKAFRKRDR